MLLLALVFLGGKIEAATLRAGFSFGGNPGRLAVQVSQGRITAVEVFVPKVDLPPPYDVFDFGTPTTYNGAPGREFDQILSATLTSKAVLRYTQITRSRAREFQAEEKTYAYAGTQTLFRPDDGSASIVTAQDLTPYSHTASAAARFNATVIRKLRGKTLEITFDHNTWNMVPLKPISIDSVTLTFSPSKGTDRWTVKIRLDRMVMRGDYDTLAAYTATARLHGRAEIDPALFRQIALPLL
jgi:hypothetical protein